MTELTHADINTIAWMMIAVLNAYTAYISHRNSNKIEHIQKSTNSMKDALIESTAKASLAEGTAIGRKEVTDEMKTENKPK